MVTKDSVEKQLKRVKFNQHGWGRGEVMELPNILLPDEEVYEVVNGIYEGGFAIIVATSVRVLLIDKKPLNFLNVEDMRFDMINELDYSHRLLGAHITISAGAKTLKFMSYNQKRLRNAISHVQHCMAEIKKKQSEHQEDQSQHLERLNQQLQSYLLAQHKSTERLHQKLSGNDRPDLNPDDLQLPKPDPQLADYLYAQSLLAQYQDEAEKFKKEPPKTSNSDVQEGEVLADDGTTDRAQQASLPEPDQPLLPSGGDSANPQMVDLYQEGMQEIFGRRVANEPQPQQPPAQATGQAESASDSKPKNSKPLLSFDINPLKVAYSRLPMALRNRKFGRPSFHAHSKAEQPPPLGQHGEAPAV